MPAAPHIAVNARLLLPGRVEGISRFGWEVLGRMAERNPSVRFTWFFDRPYDRQRMVWDNVRALVVPPAARHPLLWHLWFHAELPLLLSSLRPSLFFSPEFYLTSHPRIPQVPVFHDLAYEHFPGDLRPWASRYVRRWSPRYARRAAHILTVSEFTRQDLVSRYGVSPGKISVVYNGASEGFRPLPLAEQQAVRQRHSEGRPYFLFVGTLSPRKNIESLLRAFDQVADSAPEYCLLLAGRRGWNYEGALRTYEAMRHRDAVRFTGFLEDRELAAVYASAAALLYVPTLEGFGLPIVEAMNSGTPVITSNRSSMPEVAGEAALLADPFSVESIAGAMLRLLQEAPLPALLREKGFLQARRFSWDRSYEAVWQVLSRWL
jgi:glycosyltransferase involved in cell wall biosynthesis